MSSFKLFRGKIELSMIIQCTCVHFQQSCATNLCRRNEYIFGKKTLENYESFYFLFMMDYILLCFLYYILTLSFYKSLFVQLICFFYKTSSYMKCFGNFDSSIWKFCERNRSLCFYYDDPTLYKSLLQYLIHFFHHIDLL